MNSLRLLCAVSISVPLLWSCATYSSLDGLAGGGAGGGGSSGTASTEGGDSSAGRDQGGSAADMSGSAGKASGGASGSGAGTGNAGTASGAGAAGGSSAPLHPSTLTLADEAMDVLREPDPDGEVFSDRCPPNEVVIGFYGTIDDPADPNGSTYLRSVQAVCGKLSIAKSEPWLVSVTETTELPMHKYESAEPQIVKCPTNQVMTGFSGRSGLWMDSFDIRCSKLTILGSSPSFLLVIGTPSTAGTIGGPSGGSPFDPLECPADMLAVGQSGRTIYSGDVFGALGVQCATVTLGLAE